MGIFGKTKKTVAPLLAEAEVEARLNEFAFAAAKKAELIAQLDEAIAQVREKFTSLISAEDSKLSAITEEVYRYAEANKEHLFGNKRSQEYLAATIGYRRSTPKLKTLKGFTWNAVAKLLEEFSPAFVRTKSEVDKELLLAKREDKEVQALLEKVGVEVAQDEVFFIEAKTETDSVRKL